MKYPSINYGGMTTNLDPATGIRYGVISQHSVPDLCDDIFTHGRDLAWEAALKEAIAEAGDDPNEDRIIEELSLNWETDFNNYLYEQDGYKITGCLQSDLFILKSPYYTHAPFCSPCVPGAGNLNQALTMAELVECMDFPKVYCLGHDCFPEGKAPYIVMTLDGRGVLP